MFIVSVPSIIIPNSIMGKYNLHDEKDHIYFQMVIDLYGTDSQSPNVVVNSLNLLDSVLQMSYFKQYMWFAPVFCAYIVKYWVDK